MRDKRGESGNRTQSSEQEVCEQLACQEFEKEKQGDLQEVVHRKSDATQRCADKQEIALKMRMVWWRKAWWVRVENGPNLRTASKRRLAVRAATRVLEETRRCDESCAAGEAAVPQGCDATSYVTKEDLLLVRSLMKKEMADEVRPQGVPRETSACEVRECQMKTDETSMWPRSSKK